MGLTTYDEFKRLLRKSERAWHLEMKDTYTVEKEDAPFRRFLDGEPDNYAWMTAWFDFINEVTNAGVLVQRARVVSVPHTDYTRWALAVARHNVRAGEDIRYLPRHRAGGIDFPLEDFWLFDDDVLVLSVFSEDGRTGGFARAPDPDLTARCRTVRDQVWSRAIPFADYVG